MIFDIQWLNFGKNDSLLLLLRQVLIYFGITINISISYRWKQYHCDKEATFDNCLYSGGHAKVLFITEKTNVALWWVLISIYLVCRHLCSHKHAHQLGTTHTCVWNTNANRHAYNCSQNKHDWKLQNHRQKLTYRVFLYYILMCLYCHISTWR